jgi:chemotaxis protein CheX
MTNEVNQDQIITAVTAATQDVFSTMLNVPIDLGEAHNEPAEPASSFDGIIALVGVAGSWTGTGRITCSATMACKLAGALLMSEYESVNEDVLDAMAEIANMIIGNVKTSFEETLGPLGLSVPTVIFGRKYYARSAGVQNWTVVPFRWGDDVMEVRFCLMPNKVNHHLVHRPEPAMFA